MGYRTDRAAGSAAAIQDLVDARVREGRAPASSFAVVTPEGVVATGAAGAPAPGPGTAFRVASCTKSFTAALLLQAVEAGALALDEPLDDVLPMRVLGASRAPTLGELASMAGGIPVDDPWADRQESMPAADLDALLAAGIRLVREPGTRYEYSSLAYAILGRVLEVATATPFPRLLRERLLDPLGLTELALDRSAGVPIAPGFARVDGAWAEQPWAEPGAFSPLGGIVASPAGLARWAAWLAAAWRDGADDAVLPAARRRLMQSPQTPVPALHRAYGYGLVVEEDPRHGRIVSHSGGYPGYGAHMRWHAASGIGVVVLENARYSGATVPATQALALLLDGALASPAPALWPETAAARETVERLLRRWDDDALAAIAADDLALDEPFALRRRSAEALAARADVPAEVLPLGSAAAWSDSPAHLAWSVPGARGTLRCEIRMTPVAEPRLQALVIRLG